MDPAAPGVAGSFLSRSPSRLIMGQTLPGKLRRVICAGWLGTDGRNIRIQGVTDLSNPGTKTSMLAVPHLALKVLAAGVWYVGGVMMLRKGGSLLMEADSLNPGASWPWLAGAGGLVLGLLKGKYLFVRNCRNNLDRIAALEDPKVWQFFSPKFFVALAAMILTGSTLSRLAHGHYPWLIGVATLDFTISTALWWSSQVFWRYRTGLKG